MLNVRITFTVFALGLLGQNFSAEACTPEEAVAKAISSYPSIQSGIEKVKADRALLLATWTNLLPTFTPSYAITHTSVNPPMHMIGIPSPLTSSLTNIGFSVPIFDSGVTFFQAQALRASTRAQEQAVNVVKNSVATQAIQAYVMVALARRQLSLYQELRSRIEKLSQSPSNTEQLQALLQSDYEDISDSLRTFQESSEEAEHTYEAVIGESPEIQLQDLRLVGDSITIPADADAAFVIAQALNPSLLGAHETVNAAKSTKNSQIVKEFAPNSTYTFVDINGDRTVNGTNASPTVRTGVLTAGLSVSLGAPLRILAANHTVKSAEFDEQTTSIQLRLAIRNAYSQDNAFALRVATLTASYDQVQAAYDTVARQIDSGAATDVHAARQIVLNMRKATDAIVAASSQRVLSRAQIRALVGNLSEY